MTASGIWITPSGTDKGSLKPDEVVCVAPDGVFEGPLKPSMEYPLHREVYKVRPDVRALIHAHPPLLTSFSIVHRIPDTTMIREWDEICGTAGYAGYATPGNAAMAGRVAPEFTKGHDVVIMENHAVVAGGKDLAEALARLETLENCARTTHAAGFIGEIMMPGDTQSDNGDLSAGSSIRESNRDMRPGRRNSVISHDEEVLAEEICRMTVRACTRGLMYGFSGTVSSRTGHSDYLITPERILRCDIRKQDIIKAGYGDLTGSNSFSEVADSAVAGERAVADNGTGSSASGSARTECIHAEIYRRFTSVNAVVTARPPYLMAYAVTGREIDVRTIPESWLLLQGMPVAPFGSLSAGREEVFDKLGAGSPAVLIANDSVLVTGESLLQAFDRLEVAEMTAMSLILGESLGSVKPISEDNIDELRRNFFSK